MSQHKKLRERAIERLMRDLHGIDSNDLEYLAYALAQLIQGRPLVHRGLSVRGRPVGYTVDIFSLDHGVIAECSAEAGYFSGDYVKLRKDIRHAKAKAPTCELLYLFSTEECENSMWTEVGSVVVEERFGTCKIEVYDSRRCAEVIFDRVVVANRQLDAIAELLPSLRQIFDAHIFEQAAPPRPSDFIDDPIRAELLATELSTHPILVVHGLSGSGKSYAARDYAGQHGARYASVHWLSGSDLTNVTDLRAVPVSRLGVKLNLAFQMTDNPSLLVIDSYEDDFPRLSRLLSGHLHEGSRVLVTSQHHPGSLPACELPDMSDPAVTQLLGYENPTPPTEAQIAEIVSIAGRHPLVLSILRDVVRETGTSWSVLIDDVRTGLGAYETPQHETIIDRILGRHQEGIRNELGFLRWLSVKTLDNRFAEYFLGISGLQKLVRRSILKPAAHGYVRMHDLVFACLSRATPPSGHLPSAKFWEYFQQNWELSPYHFQRSLHLHHTRLAEGHNPTDPEPGLQSYLCLLHGRENFTPKGLAALAARDLTPMAKDRAASASIVEAIEQVWRSSDEGRDSPKLAEGEARLTQALHGEMPLPVRLDLLHHRGKLRRWAGKNEAAATDFTAVLADRPGSWHAHLQLARIYGTEDPPRAADHLRRIFAAFEADEHGVAATVILAALGELGRHELKDLRAEVFRSRIDVVSRAVAVSMVEGFSQPYQMLARIGRHLSYTHPREFIKLMSEVNLPRAEDVAPRECFDMAECQKLFGKAHREESGDPAALSRWCRRALDYYGRVVRPDSFQLVMHAECQLLLEEYAAAREILARIPLNDRNAHWWHRQAQALQGTRDFAGALDAIEKAIGGLPTTTFRAAFLRTRSRIQADLGDPASIDTLREALDASTEPKFKNQLELELASLHNRFSRP